MDDKLEHHYNSLERVKQGKESKVKWVNKETFEEEILNNKESDQFMIEILKDHCQACKLTKFNTDTLSLKLDKHQLLDKIPFYRMKITNQIPQLGDFPHSPMHFYVRKEGNDIVEIKLLKSPV